MFFSQKPWVLNMFVGLFVILFYVLFLPYTKLPKNIKKRTYWQTNLCFSQSLCLEVLQTKYQGPKPGLRFWSFFLLNNSSISVYGFIQLQLF